MTDVCSEWPCQERWFTNIAFNLLRKSLPRRSTFPGSLAKVSALSCIGKFSVLIPENGFNYSESCLHDFPQSLQTNGSMTSQSRAGQIQRKGGPHNSLRTRLRAALLYTYIEKWKFNQLKRRYLQTISYAKSTVEWTGYNTKKYLFTACCLKTDDLYFENIFYANKHAVLCSVDILWTASVV